MTSEDSPDRKKRKVNAEEEEEEEEVVVVVNTKDKEEGAARESSFVASASASALSTQASAAGLSLLYDGSPYNHYVYSQRKCSYRIRLCMPSSHILPLVTLQPPLFLLPPCRRWFCRY
jgi:hypothetical protein